MPVEGITKAKMVISSAVGETLNSCVSVGCGFYIFSGNANGGEKILMIK